MMATDTTDRPRARSLAVTSGKGGVGKTFVSANLGAALARQGFKVLVLDADLGLANLDVVLNLPPHVTLHDVLVGKRSLDEALMKGPCGMDVLLAGSGMVEYSRLTPGVREALHDVLDQLLPRYDHVILDTGAGISDVVLYTVSLAGEVLLVVTPEPTSMTDAYATVKVLAQTQHRRQVQVVVNQTRRQGEARAVCNQLQTVVDRFCNPTLDSALRLELVGDIPSDPAVRDAVSRRQLLLEAMPGAPAAMAIVDAATRRVR
jgi:flagellar biosynthesis protein FlhG